MGNFIILCKQSKSKDFTKGRTYRVADGWLKTDNDWIKSNYKTIEQIQSDFKDCKFEMYDENIL